jgi:hypothetical protein
VIRCAKVLALSLYLPGLSWLTHQQDLAAKVLSDNLAARCVWMPWCSAMDSSTRIARMCYENPTVLIDKPI